MAVFQRKTRVAAPLDRVWAFHSTIEGLERLTPSWADLRVEALRVPDDEAGDTLLAGSEIDLSIRPFPMGPRQTWTSIITERAEGEDEAYFVDEMRDGPMEEWRHTHSFTAVGDETILNDRVVFRTPYGKGADRAARFGMNLAFTFRHRRTREILGQA